jgi:hypothetical protein
MIHGATEAFVVLGQRFVDMSCGDRCVAGSNCNLVEIRYEISRSIDAVDGGPLMGIHLQAPDIVRPSAQGDRKLESHSAAGGGMDDIEGNLTAFQDRPDIASAMFDERNRGLPASSHFLTRFNSHGDAVRARYPT